MIDFRFQWKKKYIKQFGIMCKISLKEKRKKNWKQTHSYVRKPKDLWTVFKALDWPFKSDGCIVTSILENYIIRDDTSQILKTFKPNKKCWRQNFPSFLINTQLILFLIIKKTCNIFKFQSGSNSWRCLIQVVEIWSSLSNVKEVLER